MKLATYSQPGQTPRVGVVVEGGIVGVGEQQQMLELIKGGKPALAQLQQIISGQTPIPLSQVHLHAPVLNPPEFLVVGANYRDHLVEAKMKVPEIPIITNKQTSCISGPYDNVVKPRTSDHLDYEGELGIIVGETKRYLTREEAASAIYGYVVVNDLSVRDWQFMSATVTIGKSGDTLGPFGPWIVTADEIPNPQALTIKTKVNGETRQNGTTADMIWDCCDILCYLSQYMTLKPGTVITTGTVAGVGIFHGNPPPSYLRVGDEVTVEISGIGHITNRVVAEA